jgi:ABC-type glycerol-3-phosphate transport system substrate-binding protein
MVRTGALFLAMAMVLAACSPKAPGTPAGPDGDKIVLTGDQKTDWAQIVALEDQAKALVKIDGCSSAADCRTAAVGSRACGSVQ